MQRRHLHAWELLLQPGDHVAFCLENHPRFLQIAWGAHYAGLYYTAISSRLTAEETEYIVNDCGAQVFITSRYKADVAAEISGRIVATPVERGSRVAAGAALVQITGTEADAQAAEAQANAAQIEARLGIASGAPFDVERVPEVANARAAFELARADLQRAESLREQQLISRADFDQRATQTAAAERLRRRDVLAHDPNPPQRRPSLRACVII